MSFFYPFYNKDSFDGAKVQTNIILKSNMSKKVLNRLHFLTL